MLIMSDPPLCFLAALDLVWLYPIPGLKTKSAFYKSLDKGVLKCQRLISYILYHIWLACVERTSQSPLAEFRPLNLTGTKYTANSLTMQVTTIVAKDPACFCHTVFCLGGGGVPCSHCCVGNCDIALYWGETSLSKARQSGIAISFSSTNDNIFKNQTDLKKRFWFFGCFLQTPISTLNPRAHNIKQLIADTVFCFFFHQHQTLFSTEWKHCRDFEVIVRWAHAFLFWPCLPTTMCSTHLHLFIFTSLYIQRYSHIP